MATRQAFGGKTYMIPGVYSRIVSGRKNPPLDLDYGKLLIIADKDQVLGGAGISGAGSNGKGSIYTMNDVDDMQTFVGQGIWWKAAESLFRPNKFDPGVSKVMIVRPYTTTPAVMTLSLETGTNGGKIEIETLTEGSLSNGVEETINTVDYLIGGYAFTVTTGEVDPSKWMLKFWLSSYKGAPADTYPYDEITKELSTPYLLMKSAEFDNIHTLIDWVTTDRNFAKIFKVKSTHVKGTGAIAALEIGAVTGNQLATGATETAETGDFEAMLDAIVDLDYNAVMYLSGEGLESDTNTIKLINHISYDAKFDKFIILGGSNDDLAESIESAVAINSDKVILVHGSIEKRSQMSTTGFRTWNSQIHASYIAGRLLGLPPQVPITFKAIDIDGVSNKFNIKQRETALNSGVIVTNYDEERSLFVVEQGINTLQNNEFTLNPDGTSHVIQIKRIAAQLNKDLVYNAKRDLLSNPNGVNRNTLSPRLLLDWTKTFLQRKVATDQTDNIILSFQDVTVTRNEDAYFVTYKFEPNSEIRMLFFTGFML